MLTVSAVAGPENSVPDGRRYDLLVFARAYDEAESAAVAENGLEMLGWTDRRVARIGEITDAAAVPEDLAPAMHRALAHGCAVIVYEEP